MNRTIHARMMLALAIAAIVGALGLSNAGSKDPAGASTQVADREAAATIPTLPTVLVEAQAEIPTLPLVIVHADVNAEPVVESTHLLASNSGGSPSLGMPDVLPHVRLDMPYYSFGKLLPRAIKE